MQKIEMQPDSYWNAKDICINEFLIKNYRLKVNFIYNIVLHQRENL